MQRWLIAICILMSTWSIARADDEIVVGEYGSMTGSEATFGISTDNGVKMAVKEINAAGGVNGKKIKLIAYDDQGKQQETITAVTRLIQQDHVVAVIGEVASSRSLAGGQVCQRSGVPMISPSSTNPKVTADWQYDFARLLYRSVPGVRGGFVREGKARLHEGGGAI